MDKVIVVTGATACGKSAVAVKLAQLFNGEIISGDSIQIYRGLDIGSAKISEAEKQGIKHHLIDIKDYNETYSVYDFQKAGRVIISDLTEKGKLPIVCGGTGLFIKALIYDYQFKDSTTKRGTYDDLSNEELYEMINSRDSEAAGKLHVNNRKRLMRTMDLLADLPGNKTEFLAQQSKQPIYDALLIGLTRTRQSLIERIDQRVEAMFAAGLAQEVAGLVANDAQVFSYQAFQAIGYKEFAAYYQGLASEDEVKEKIKVHSRQFAKRQGTWFKNQLPLTWFDLDNGNGFSELVQFIRNWK